MKTPCMFCNNNFNYLSPLAQCCSITPADLPADRILHSSPYLRDGYVINGDGLKDCPAYTLSRTVFLEYWLAQMEIILQALAMTVVVFGISLMLALLIGGAVL